MTAHIINARNVNDAFPQGLLHLTDAGITEQSRNGPVLVAPGPVITQYHRPWERVLWEPRRDANPVFHLMESIWMLAGANDVSFLLPFNARFKEYAEDDGKAHGAYGFRWREHFALDQIDDVIAELRANPASRRAVIAMWDPAYDLGANKRDLPCNTHIYFDLRGGKLNMTVSNRSNDMLWGAYGANSVHMSMLQEVIASAVGAPMGTYTQFSNNFHLYTDVPQVKSFLADSPWCDDMYLEPLGPKPTPLIQGNESYEQFLLDCQELVDLKSLRKRIYRTKFFNEIAAPLRMKYLERKKDGSCLLGDLNMNNDWHAAFAHWVSRRDEV